MDTVDSAGGVAHGLRGRKKVARFQKFIASDWDGLIDTLGGLSSWSVHHVHVLCYLSRNSQFPHLPNPPAVYDDSAVWSEEVRLLPTGFLQSRSQATPSVWLLLNPQSSFRSCGPDNTLKALGTGKANASELTISLSTLIRPIHSPSRRRR